MENHPVFFDPEEGDHKGTPLQKHNLPTLSEYLKEIESLSDLKQKLSEYSLAIASAMTDEYAYDEPLDYIELADYGKVIADFLNVL